MSGKRITLGPKGPGTLFTILTMVLTLLLIPLLAACTTPSATTQAPTSSEPVTATTAPATPTALAVKPQGELVAALSKASAIGNFLPWADPTSASLDMIVYDMLIYWDNVNFKFQPGLAESWDVSPDGLTLTYHLRKGVQWQDGWGEFTSADVKYNFEMHASSQSAGKTAQCRRIASMDTPDPYTLVVHFKDPYPNFLYGFIYG